MAHDHDRPHAQHRGAIFEAGDDVAGGDIAGHPGDEHLADALIEHQLDRYAGIGAGEHGGEGFLTAGVGLLQKSEILFERGERVAHEPVVAGHQPGDRGFGGEARLGPRPARGQHRAAAGHQRRPGGQKAPSWQVQVGRLPAGAQTGRASAGVAA